MRLTYERTYVYRGPEPGGECVPSGIKDRPRTDASDTRPGPCPTGDPLHAGPDEVYPTVTSAPPITPVGSERARHLPHSPLDARDRQGVLRSRLPATCPIPRTRRRWARGAFLSRSPTPLPGRYRMCSVRPPGPAHEAITAGREGSPGPASSATGRGGKERRR